MRHGVCLAHTGNYQLQRSVVLEIKRDITGDDAIGKTHTLDMSFLPAVCGRGVDMVVEGATRPVDYISPDGGDTTLHRVHLKIQRTGDSSRYDNPNLTNQLVV